MDTELGRNLAYTIQEKKNIADGLSGHPLLRKTNLRRKSGGGQ
jgi:hypothetical protein